MMLAFNFVRQVMTPLGVQFKLAGELMTNVIDIYGLTGDRGQLREQLINTFMREHPGNGTGQLASKYRYNVETTGTNTIIFLKRPAALNKGMDFTVHVEGYRFRDRGLIDMPSHKNIIEDLKEKKSDLSRQQYDQISHLINRIYVCEDINRNDIPNINRNTGLRPDQLLLAIRWLFIEQDVTYWNWSGRSMFMSALQNEGLC